MVDSLAIWLLVAGFLGAGLFNAIGTAKTRLDFARWGLPPWWRMLTAGLEIVSAALIAFPASRMAGLVLGAAIIAGAIVIVLRYRDVSHLVPLSAFVLLLMLTAVFA